MKFGDKKAIVFEYLELIEIIKFFNEIGALNRLNIGLIELYNNYNSLDPEEKKYLKLKYDKHINYKELQSIFNKSSSTLIKYENKIFDKLKLFN